MADTVFQDNVASASNLVYAAWLNDQNNLTYRGIDPKYATTTGTANAQVLTISAMSSTATLTAGMTFTFKVGAGLTNTAATTLTINSFAATSVTNFDGSALRAGQMAAGQIVTVSYDGTQYQLLTASNSGVFGAISATTLTLSGALTYGGVTLTAAVTGTGKMVLDTSPTLATPTINSAAHVGGTWVADATWTLPAFTLGGTVSGGGNQINNVVIGTSTPLAGSFTTATANAFVPNSSSVPTNGMYLPAANTLGWATNSAEKLRLDSSGNLGLGVTPATGVTGYAGIQIGNANLVGRTGNTTNSEMYLLANSTVDDKYIGTDYAAMFSSNDGAFYWKTAASGTAGNAISWTTVLSIDANGCLSGTASSGYAATFNNTNAAGAGVKVHYTNTINDATHYFVFFDDPGNTRAACLSNGNWQNINNSYGATSDRKLKQDIVLAGSQLSDVLALSRIVTKFRRKAEPYGPLQIGFVAQDVLGISPGLVEECPDLDAYGNPNGEVTLAVKYSIAYMKNLKATGELIERTDNHESRLTQDRTDIDAIKLKLGIA